MSLPIFDFSNLTLKISELKVALTDIGFFALTGHNLDPAEMFSISKAFFNADMETKSSYKYDPATNAGYLTIGAEKLHRQVERKEALNFRKDLIKEENTHFPDKAKVEAFIRQCHVVCTELLRVFAKCLGITDHDFFTARHKYESSSGDVLRFLHYPAHNDPITDEDITRAGSHSDFGSLTLLFTEPNDPGGLEILVNNTFQPVKVPDNSIIVNVGDLIEFWSQGLFKSAIHRVVHVSDPSPRYSIVYFCHAEDNSTLEPLPLDSSTLASVVKRNGDFQDASHAMKVSGGNPNTAGDHLKMRLQFTR